MIYTIYVVDDEKDLLLLTQKYLEKEGYSVSSFSDGKSAMDAIGGDVHLWLLDIMLGGDVSGYDLIKSIKKHSNTPVIFMSARDQELDRIMGLELGSDDYITKPFSMREMVLRVGNVIKRVYTETANDTMQYAEYTIDIAKRSIEMGGEPIPLTSKEMDMVIFFVSNLDQSFTRDQLLNKIWGDDYFGSDRVVDDLIKRIRKKMPNFGIETIYGYGYRLKK
ncbi:MAG: response regulator transcription factor [Clostridiales bacterium]|nr:response regulator transcription factor [Clostridiales bacterium]